VLSWQLTPSVALDPLHRCSFQQNEGLSGVCQPFVISFAMRGGKKFTAVHSDRRTVVDPLSQNDFIGHLNGPYLTRQANSGPDFFAIC
jgi:hypothetical protein